MTAPKAARGDADSIDTPTVEDGRTFLRYYLDNRDDTKEGMQEFVDAKKDALRASGVDFASDERERTTRRPTMDDCDR
jgi:hypothetical protein